jgi:hypothetical protein
MGTEGVLDTATLRLQSYDGCRTNLKDSMYDDIVFASIPHSIARFLSNSGVCTLWAPEIISSPVISEKMVQYEI